MNALTRLAVRVLTWSAVLCHLLGIWWLSSQGANVTQPVDEAGITDLQAHLILYGSLSFWLFWALWTSFPRLRLSHLTASATGGAFGYGLLDELHQRFVPERGTDIQDLLGNLLGSFAAPVFALIILWTWRRLGDRQMRRDQPRLQ